MAETLGALNWDSSMSRFLSLVVDARQRDWCMRPLCTTCGATEFKDALRYLGVELAGDLATLELEALESVAEWQNPMRLALDELASPDLKDRVF